MKLSPRFFLFGIFIGVGLVWGIWRFLPDGKLHVVFCDVGQGDAIYIRMPNQADMLIDGGPNDRVLTCLGNNMPFYDRTIDLVVLTHPQKDHLQGLISVIERYDVKYFASIPVSHTTQRYTDLVDILKKVKVPVKFLTTGDKLKFSHVSLDVLWPQEAWLIKTLVLDSHELNQLNQAESQGRVLGFSTDLDLNIFSIYLHLKFGNFDLLLTGDGDRQVQLALADLGLSDLVPEQIEVLKVPHHGSRTGLTDDFVEKVRPKLSIIEVGKNSYGHPTQETIDKLTKWGKVLRTDTSGEIEIITDGVNWQLRE